MSGAEFSLEIAAIKPDHLGFIEIYNDYYPFVYSVARRALGSADDADDVAQETFIKLFKRWPRPRIDTSLKAWLARVALNLAYSGHRVQKRRLALDEKLAGLRAAPAESAESEVISAFENALAAKVLAGFKKRDRDVLIARHSGLSYREAADVAGVRPASVGKVLARAESKFRDVYLGLENENGR